MIKAMTSWRGGLFGAMLVLGVATLTLAQGGANNAAPAPAAPILEFTQQEVQPALLVQTLNEMSKQRWEIFQVVPVWAINNDNGQPELTPKMYQVFGRRPVAGSR